MNATYKDMYEAFLERYRGSDQIGPEEVAAEIAKFVRIYVEFNTERIEALKKRIDVAADIEQRTENGKAITSAKAKTIVDATPEADVVRVFETHLDNLEHILSALRSMQRAMSREYGEMSKGY